MNKFLIFIILLCFSFNLYATPKSEIQVGADQLTTLLPLLNKQRVALVVNHTSCLNNGTHLLDTLVARKVNICKVFAPEHGFRGDADAGEVVSNNRDKRTGIEIISLYGANKKPSKETLQNVDIVVFDIQDVGARFYTYISTMHYVMEACAESNKTMIILDRPNPHDYIDGPILDNKFKSFVGMHPIPILHGLTVGELAQMINGEAWLKDGLKCNIQVITTKGWEHGQPYSLPIKPSPNLPKDQAIKLYASLCFFESTNVSVGRGTLFPFQVIGYPDPKFGDFKFKPISLPGYDKNPLQRDKTCYGLDLRKETIDKGLSLKYLISFYKHSNKSHNFFKSPKFMDLLAGSDQLRTQIINGLTEDQIRKSWNSGLIAYKNKRNKYLLYPDNINRK